MPCPAPQQVIHGGDAAQTLHGGGDGDGGSQYAVCQQGRAAQHGRDDQPLAAVFYQGVEGEDTALAMVVRFHGDEYVLDGGQQRDGPYDQGQRADDKRLVGLTDAAVPLQDGFHHVHGGGADVAVDDTDGHQDHAQPELLPGLSLSRTQRMQNVVHVGFLSYVRDRSFAPYSVL